MEHFLPPLSAHLVRKYCRCRGSIPDCKHTLLREQLDALTSSDLTGLRLTRELMADCKRISYSRSSSIDFMDDIRQFHEKFGLTPTDGEFGPHVLDEKQQRFRIKFLFEELLEYCKAVGYVPTVIGNTFSLELAQDHSNEPADAFDALIDLVYVALGTAYLHGFPFAQGWQRVQAANMQKVKAASADDSKRGYKNDIVKPPGWTAPVLDDLL